MGNSRDINITLLSIFKVSSLLEDAYELGRHGRHATVNQSLDVSGQEKSSSTDPHDDKNASSSCDDAVEAAKSRISEVAVEIGRCDIWFL
jgi:hypothetical protein